MKYTEVSCPEGGKINCNDYKKIYKFTENNFKTSK